MIVRLVDEINDECLIEDRVFEDAEIRGPAMLIPSGPVDLDDCSLGGPFDEVCHAIEGPIVRGGIGLVNVTFRRCDFVDVGFLGPQEFVDALRDAYERGQGAN